MAVSKRLRYEVLRRDNFTCRYCGAYAPFAILEADHVIPRARGGLDVAENLVAACQNCNAGKTDTWPPSWLPGEIEQAERQWRSLPQPEPDEDDLREMEIYQESMHTLTALSASEVLHWIARAYIAAIPYRPEHSELIIAAGSMARRTTVSPHKGA